MSDASAPILQLDIDVADGNGDDIDRHLEQVLASVHGAPVAARHPQLSAAAE